MLARCGLSSLHAPCQSMAVLTCTAMSRAHRQRMRTGQRSMRNVHIVLAADPNSPGDLGPPMPTAVEGPTNAQRLEALQLQLAVTPHTAFRLAAAHPSLDVLELVQSTRALAASLGLPMEELAVLASKETRLLSTPIQQLSQSLAMLQGLCLGGLTLQETSRVIVFSPGLLAVPAERLEANFNALVEALGVEGGLLCRLARQQPYVLTTSMIKVQQQFQVLGSLLSITPQRAVELAIAQPMLVMSPSLLVQKLGALAQTLRVSDQADIIQMAVAFPPILGVNTHATAAWVQAVASSLQLPQSEVAKFLVQAPGIISLQPGLLQSRFNTLRTVMPTRSRGEVLAMVAAQPSLLGLGDNGLDALEPQP